jgi:hypothetical protein
MFLRFDYLRNWHFDFPVKELSPRRFEIFVFIGDLPEFVQLVDR